MLLCFFFNVDSGIVVFLNTASLSQNAFIGPSMGIPNMHNLLHTASMCSTAILMAINSLPNVLVSMVFCRLLYQTIGAQFKNMRIPVCDLRVTVFDAWSTSTKQWLDTARLRRGGGGGGHVDWHLLLSVTVEIVPLVPAEGVLVNVRMPWVKE